MSEDNTGRNGIVKEKPLNREANTVDESIAGADIKSVQPVQGRKSKKGLYLTGVFLFLALVIFMINYFSGPYYLLEVTDMPEQLEQGEEFSIIGFVENKGRNQEIITLNLSVDGVDKTEKELIVEAGTKKEISFTLTGFDSPGMYEIALNGWVGTTRVLEPAEFSVDEFAISPNPVISGEEAFVSALVTNTGEAKGLLKLDLLIDQDVEQSKSVELEGSEARRISIPLIINHPGSYHVAINEYADDYLSVLQPAAIEIKGLTLTPSTIQVGQEAVVTVEVANTGEVDESFNISLSLNGVVEDTKTVDLKSNSTEQVIFNISRNSSGYYSVSVNELSRTLEVRDEERPSEENVGIDRPQTGIIIGDYSDSPQGLGTLRINSNLGKDAFLIIASPFLSNPFQGIYIRGGDSVTLTGIPERSYSLYLTFGQDWDESVMRFTNNKVYLKYKGTVKIKQDDFTDVQVRVVLSPVGDWDIISPTVLPVFN